MPVPPAEWLPVASVPALVSEEEFARVQAKLARNRAFARRHNTRHAYLLRALVSCGLCRSSCLCRTVHPRYGYYVCGGKADPVHGGRDEPCPARYAPAHRLDALVWRDLCELLTEPGSIAQALARAHGGGWLPQELQARPPRKARDREGVELVAVLRNELRLDAIRRPGEGHFRSPRAQCFGHRERRGDVPDRSPGRDQAPQLALLSHDHRRC